MGLGLLAVVILGVPRLVPEARLVWTVLGLVIGNQLLTAAVFLWRSRQANEPRQAWRWLALGPLIHALANLATPWLYGNTPLILTVFIGYVVAMAIGMTSWFEGGPFWAGGSRRMLEGLIFALALFTLSWQAVLGDSATVPWADRLIRLSNTTTFAMLLGVALFLALVDLRRLRGPLGWMSLSMLLLCLNNLVALWFQIRGPRPPLHPTILLVPIFLLPMLGAAFIPWTRDALTREEGRGQNPWGGVVAYLPFGLALVWFLASQRPGIPPDPVLMSLVGAMALVMLVRQLIALRDQASFARILRERLEERTQALEASQAALMRTQRLNLVATVGAGMAHDLNNLLSAVCALAELEGGHENLIRTAHQAAALARKTMAHAGNPGAERELFELGERVAELVPMLKRLSGHGVSLGFTRDGEECWLEADPLQVEQMLVNLVTNARDAMGGKGTIRITLRAEGEACLLEVRDDGPGIPEEIQAQIFDPFFTTKGKGLGTGLGLPSIKAFLDEQGGRIEVDSAPGLGAGFRIHLPRVDAL